MSLATYFVRMPSLDQTTQNEILTTTLQLDVHSDFRGLPRARAKWNFVTRRVDYDIDRRLPSSSDDRQWSRVFPKRQSHKLYVVIAP